MPRITLTKRDGKHTSCRVPRRAAENLLLDLLRARRAIRKALEQTDHLKLARSAIPNDAARELEQLLGELASLFAEDLAA